MGYFAFAIVTRTIDGSMPNDDTMAIHPMCYYRCYSINFAINCSPCTPWCRCYHRSNCRPHCNAHFVWHFSVRPKKTRTSISWIYDWTMMMTCAIVSTVDARWHCFSVCCVHYSTTCCSMMDWRSTLKQQRLRSHSIVWPMMRTWTRTRARGLVSLLPWPTMCWPAFSLVTTLGDFVAANRFELVDSSVRAGSFCARALGVSPASQKNWLLRWWRLASTVFACSDISQLADASVLHNAFGWPPSERSMNQRQTMRLWTMHRYLREHHHCHWHSLQSM